ncbi:hypothetical protein, conserved [Trypanosoma brucei brucei TREU927]|uniref:Uncharacterized protein n=1 Tax=Trypanosoma brucei brucei (strain 927/4 GUTat10.1) TaxID=185431 RepID=Q584A2_TRYB2|nr:hypothetical protein, conserved [Trypanosoma brucei brucei TREU927]AAX79815.1 hypothetical protein, conserved [Trypanosoma brucei]AAZ10916.1 hypothetical protein, conserved [Trypanosoma brucei brucei TREU927]
MGNKKHMLSKLLFACFVYEGDNMISVGGVVIMFSFLVVACANSGPEGDEKGKGKALTQSDANAICSIVRKLRELRNNVTHNMKFGEKIVDEAEDVKSYYGAKVMSKKMLVSVLEKVMAEEKSSFSGMERILEKMGELRDGLGKTITSMNASLRAMRLPSWNLVNISDSYAYWIKDMVDFFHYAAFSPGSCCLVVDGGSMEDCPFDRKRGIVPRDCIVEPPQHSEGSLAEYENPLNTELSLTMGNSGNYGKTPNSYGCYITSTAGGFNTKKSFINELSGGLFYTQNNNVVANFSSVGKEFQELIDQLNTSISDIFTWNTSITGQRTILHSLLLRFEEEVGDILKRKKRVMDVTKRLGSIEDVSWYDNESYESDGMSKKPNLSEVALLLFVFSVFWK